MVENSVDVIKMQNAAKILRGEHDFKSFSSVGGNVKTTVRTIYSVSVKEKENVIKISVCGNGFLYNMVRIIVGTLVKIGQGKMSEDELKEMLAGGGRTLGGTTFPAKGLCLEKVEYK